MIHHPILFLILWAVIATIVTVVGISLRNGMSSDETDDPYRPGATEWPEVAPYGSGSGTTLISSQPVDSGDSEHDRKLREAVNVSAKPEAADEFAADNPWVVQ